MHLIHLENLLKRIVKKICENNSIDMDKEQDSKNELLIVKGIVSSLSHYIDRMEGR